MGDTIEGFGYACSDFSPAGLGMKGNEERERLVKASGSHGLSNFPDSYPVGTESMQKLDI